MLFMHLRRSTYVRDTLAGVLLGICKYVRVVEAREKVKALELMKIQELKRIQDESPDSFVDNPVHDEE